MIWDVHPGSVATLQNGVSNSFTYNHQLVTLFTLQNCAGSKPCHLFLSWSGFFGPLVTLTFGMGQGLMNVVFVQGAVI
jgi:hypothetical protein